MFVIIFCSIKKIIVIKIILWKFFLIFDVYIYNNLLIIEFEVKKYMLNCIGMFGVKWYRLYVGINDIEIVKDLKIRIFLFDCSRFWLSLC